MLLVGLWHGAAFNFILWGGLQGLGLVGTHYYQGLPEQKKIKLWGGKFLTWLLTFGFITFAWIIFRSPDVSSALDIIKNLFLSGKLVEPFPLHILIFMALGFLLVLFEIKIIALSVKVQEKIPAALIFIFAILSMVVIFNLGPNILPPFIYFGF